MSSKTVALKILDGIFVVVTMFLILVVAGLPTDWLLSMIGMSMREFQWFALFVVFGTLLLIHAIVTSDSAP